MVDAMVLILRLMRSPPMKKFSPQWLAVPMPGCEDLDPMSRSYLRCTARAFTAPFWHFSGTCRMGRRNDPMAVVDSKLRVRDLSLILVSTEDLDL